MTAAPIVPAPAYGVKALEWTGRVARSVVGAYDIAVVSDHFITYCARRWIGQFKTVDEAKAAAQADFERRILSCLSSAPVEEADAKAEAAVAQVIAESNRRDVPDPHLRRVASTIPSEPEAKGEAGAGPVGETVDDGTASTTCPKDGKECVWYPSGGCCHPVEEPGEVEGSR